MALFMAERAELKRRARRRLRVIFWPALLVCLVAIFLGDNIASSTDFVSFTLYGFLQRFLTDGSVVRMLLLLALFQFFVAGPISVGRAYFFLRTVDDDEAQISDIFFIFRTRHYWKIALCQLIATLIVLAIFILPILFVMLVAGGEGGIVRTIIQLLLLIPVIYIYYRFRLLPYILARNPDLHPKDALGRSYNWATNRRWEMLKLDISFVGWYILAPLAFGVGIFFVFPYHEATMAQYYCELEQWRSKPVQSGYEFSQSYDPSLVELSK